MFSCNKVSKWPAACFYYFSLIFSAAQRTFFSVALPIFVEKLHKTKTILNFKSNLYTISEGNYQAGHISTGRRFSQLPSATVGGCRPRSHWRKALHLDWTAHSALDQSDPYRTLQTEPTIRYSVPTLATSSKYTVHFIKKKKPQSVTFSIFTQQIYFGSSRPLLCFTVRDTDVDSDFSVLLTQLFFGAVVKFVKFEVFSSSYKEVLLWVEGGGANGGWSLHRLDQVQAGT